MTNDTHNPDFEGTELAAGHSPHPEIRDQKESDDVENISCCKGMSCRKKIILAATAALVLLAIIIACSRMCRKCKCGDEE